MLKEIKMAWASGAHIRRAAGAGARMNANTYIRRHPGCAFTDTEAALEEAEFLAEETGTDIAICAAKGGEILLVMPLVDAIDVTDARVAEVSRYSRPKWWYRDVGGS